VETVADERRKRDQRVPLVSLLIAAVLHAVAFVFVAWTQPAPTWTSGHDAIELEPDAWTGTRIEILFGPPKILSPDGEFIQEPPDRVLEAMRMMQIPPLCLGRAIPPSAPGIGEIRLTVNGIGQIDAATLNVSTGDPCWDQVAIRVAGALWYHWLPGDLVAPLEVLQPITVGLGLEHAGGP